MAAIEPVSRSAPSPEAAAAMALCGTDRIGLDRVARMGLILSARLVSNYTTLAGVEPEIQTNKPAWVVVFEGRINLGRGYWADDPVCVVIDGHPTIFSPGRSGRGEKSVEPAVQSANPGIMPLPTLAP